MTSTSFAPAPQVRARALTGFDELVIRYGGDPDDLLQKAGIRPELMNEPDAPLEHARVVQLFEQAAECLRMADFGLQLADIQGIDVLGPVAAMARSEPTVGEALDTVHRHMAYISSSAEMVVDHDARPGQAAILFALNLPGEIRHRQKSELSYAIALRLLKLLAPGWDTKDWELHFSHDHGLPANEYPQRFGCRVVLGQATEGLYFPRTLLDQTIDSADPSLARQIEKYVSHIVRRYPLDLSMQVHALLEQQLVSGKCTLPNIAQQLMMSPRSLQRRLKQQETTFDEIADGLRRQRAENLLCHSDQTLESVCSLIGYTEASTFNRACRRWFGQTPLAFRKAFRNTSGNTAASAAMQ
ncbi:AraC family transcriptional regulator [Marinobacterium weihaiense]|uniref:AraC family transcriptional regulator n=1 Tax=Marinobacterium weihaiense TaxID=2851016 RepID=A0ABS6MBI9_9GAMM|nr:AraC family transcriptional regulator [Marinobacterium weihaiense]MBV0933653.1 AraC family transcriptional regulator [Marinobacterium weihaiense]